MSPPQEVIKWFTVAFGRPLLQLPERVTSVPGEGAKDSSGTSFLFLIFFFQKVTVLLNNSTSIFSKKVTLRRNVHDFRAARFVARPTISLIHHEALFRIVAHRFHSTGAEAIACEGPAKPRLCDVQLAFSHS